MLTSECDTRLVLEALQDKLGELVEPYTDRVASSYIGLATYQPGEIQSDLLARIDQAVAEAESEAHDAVQEAAPCCQVQTPTSTEEWRLALDLAAVSLAMDRAEASPGSQASWISLASRSMADGAFRERLLEIFMKRHELLDRLWLDVHKIGVKVLSEGVESQAELDKLMEVGLDGLTGPVLGEKA